MESTQNAKNCQELYKIYKECTKSARSNRDCVNAKSVSKTSSVEIIKYMREDWEKNCIVPAHDLMVDTVEHWVTATGPAGNL